MQYSQSILNYFFEVKHAGSLNSNDDNVRCCKMGSSGQAYLIQLYIRYENDEIKEAKFQAYASPAVIAACEYLCCWLEGKTFEMAKQLNKDQIQKALNLSPLQMHVAVLVDLLWKKVYRESMAV